MWNKLPDWLPRAPGRLLMMRRGFNPNSSSLGFDVSFLLLGTVGLSVSAALVATLLRLRRPTLRSVDEVPPESGTDAAAAASPEEERGPGPAPAG